MPSQHSSLKNSVSVQNITLDLTDVPFVSVRELATAVKVLADETLALRKAHDWADSDFRRVEQLFWQRCGRDRQKKIASLIRLRCLIDVCKARILQSFIIEHGTPAVMSIIESAATLRLNTSVGFSPIKISVSARQSLKKNLSPVDVAKVAA